MTAPAAQQDYSIHADPTPDERNPRTAFEGGVIDQIRKSETRLRGEIKASEDRLCKEIQASEDRLTKEISGLRKDIKTILNHLNLN